MKKLFVLLIGIITYLTTLSQDVIGDRGIFRSVYVGSNSSYGRYMDTLLNDTSSWLGKVKSFPTAHAIAQFLQGRIDNIVIPPNSCNSKLLSPYSVIWTGIDYEFSVSAGNYQIDCDPHSNATTVIDLPDADATQDRVDVIYLGTDNAVHFVSGDLAAPGFAVEPILPSDQFKLVAITVKAATTTPTITEDIIYDENTESTASGTGVTVNSNYIISPYQGTVSTFIDATTNGDLIIWIKTSGTWSTLGKDALQFFIKLASIMPNTTTYRMTLWNSSTQVSPTEVPIAINRNDITNWQPVSISIPAFGSLLNTSFDRVRIRVTATSTHTGPVQIDYMRLVSGVVNPPVADITAGEGLSKVGNQINFGGLYGAPGTFSTNRYINTNRKTVIWSNGSIPDLVEPGGVEWGFGQEVFSPVQILGRDTVPVNDVDPPTAAVPWSTLHARRELYYPTGVFRTQKVFGHTFEMRWKWDDTLSLNTQSGDYNVGVVVDNYFQPYGTGRQGIRASHGTGQNNSRAYAAPALLVRTFLKNDGSNWIKVDGHLSGLNSYLIATNDTINQGYIYYTTGSFTNSSTSIKRTYDFAPAAQFTAPRIDSAYGWFDTARVKWWYHANKTVIGPSVGTSFPWSSTDQLRVLGNVNITDSLVLGKAHEVGDTTGMDVVLRKRSDGSIFRIRADLLGVGGGGATAINDIGDATGAGLVTVGNNSQQWDFTGLTGSGLLIQSNTTAATSLHKVFRVITTGANASSSITTFGSEITNTHTGTSSTNVGLSVSASNGTNNHALIVGPTNGNVGFGVTTPDADAILELSSTTRGFLPPRMTTAQKNAISTPPTGLIVFDTDEATLYQYNGSTWESLGGGGEATTIGAFQTGGTANGLSLSGTDIRLHAATATAPGGISTGTQSIAGTKVFNDYFQNEVGMQLKENAIGSSAASGYVWLYAKADGLIYGKDDAGVETKLSNDAGGGLTQEQVEDIVGALFGTDNGDIDFTYNDGTPDVAAQIKAGAIVNADINASAAIDGSKINGNSITKNFMYDVLTLGGVSTQIPRFLWTERFQGSSTNSVGSTFMFELVSGTGANASSVANAASITGASGYGYAELNSGTTTTGKAVLHGGHGATNNNQMGKVNNDDYYRLEFKNVIVNDLSDGTETYKIWLGFGVDNANTNGIWFTYSHSENSGVWNCHSYNNTTVETTSTATTVAADTEYDLGIEFYNQTAKFYIDGTLVATHTTQVPPAAGTMQAPIMKIIKSAGSTARVIYVDEVTLRITNENDL